MEKIFSSDVDCEATAECDPENGNLLPRARNSYLIDPRHPQRVAKCEVAVVDEDSTDLTFYFNGQRRNSAADLFCETANNKTICEVSLTLTEPITRDMLGEEIKCVYADEREESEKETTVRLTVFSPPKVVMTGDQARAMIYCKKKIEVVNESDRLFLSLTKETIQRREHAQLHSYGLPKV